MKDNWKNRSSGMICKTCIFFALKKAGISESIGRCRRHAPTMNGFPVVFTSDWCGDHKLNEDATIQKEEIILQHTIPCEGQ